MEIREML